MSYLDDFGPNESVQENSLPKSHGHSEILDSDEAEWTANERRLALMLQCSQAALNKTQAEAKFAGKYVVSDPAQSYWPPNCDGPWDCEPV